MQCQTIKLFYLAEVCLEGYSLFPLCQRSGIAAIWPLPARQCPIFGACQGYPARVARHWSGTFPGLRRHMQSSVMLHNGSAYVVDCGLGVTDLYARTGVPFSAVCSIFITHQHPDHNIEYEPFLVLGWIQGLKQSVNAFGPPPLRQMTEDYLKSAKVTIDFWAEDFKLKPFGMIDVKDLPEAGPVMQDENVKVTSVLLQHPPVRPAYGYRFDFHDRSIAFSGDTVPLEAVAQMARGADVLVHEAMYPPTIERMARGQAAQGNLGLPDDHASYER